MNLLSLDNCRIAASGRSTAGGYRGGRGAPPKQHLAYNGGRLSCCYDSERSYQSRWYIKWMSALVFKDTHRSFFGAPWEMFPLISSFLTAFLARTRMQI